MVLNNTIISKTEQSQNIFKKINCIVRLHHGENNEWNKV